MNETTASAARRSRIFSSWNIPFVQRTVTCFAAIALAACGGSASSSLPVGASPASAQDMGDGWHEDLEIPGARPLPPAGFGTLSQDNITIGLAIPEGNLAIKATPLTEWVIRMTAPDTYRRLNGYKVNRGEEILQQARRNGERGWPLVVFVMFYTRSVESTYEPYDLQIRSQNQVFRPFDILPVTPDFNRERLRQEESQVAMYLFPAEIDLDLPMTLEYDGRQSTRWTAIRSTLDRELSTVLSRVPPDGR